MGGLNFKEGIIQYYFFQKRISNYFSKKNKKEDEQEFKVGYLINPVWIKLWKNSIYYEKIKKYLDVLNITEENLEIYEDNIKLYIGKNINEEEIEFISNTVKTNNFDIFHNNIFTQNFLMNLMPEQVYKSLKINDKTTKIKINYLFKKQMMIFVPKDYYIFKIIIPDVSYFSQNKNIVNLSWKFYERELFDSKIDFFEEKESEEIMNYFIDKGIFANPRVVLTKMNTRSSHILINEDLKQKIKYGNKNNCYNYYSNGNTDTDLVIKQPKDINFDLAKRPSYRGLDNVGSFSYMNSILQCLANIKPITEYLLNANKYTEIYNNVALLCPLTLQYCQVLIGLFCNKSNTGSYSPKSFKAVVEEMIPLFQGIQANDSKDLIIFLLEVMNSELSELHNKRNNIKKEENETLVNIDSSNQDKVLKECLKNFKFSYASIIGANLCGFQKNVFICQRCGSISNNFNIFNFLSFDLKAAANHYKLNNNNNFVPILTFDHCFKYLSKEELFQNTYCQKCKLSVKSIYKENLYLIPNYLIIILNRGNGNIFNCKFEIPVIFDSSNYEERDKNKKYELIGVVSRIESNFVAFCKHSIDNKWRCYNDSIVTECKNGDYLHKGIPQILFYKKKNINFLNNNKSFNQKQNSFMNNQGFNSNINFINNTFQEGFNNINNFRRTFTFGHPNLGHLSSNNNKNNY